MANKQKRSWLRWVLILVGVISGLLLIAFFGLKKNINTGSMKHTESRNFSLYYQTLSDDAIKDIFSAVQEIHDAYADDYGLPDTMQTTIVVYSDPAQFKRAYLGYILAWIYRDSDWMVGGAYNDMLVVMSPEVDDGMHSYADKLEIFKHELIHVYNFSLNPMPDMFLDEGLAELLSGQGETEQKPDGPIPSFKEMQSWNFSEFGENGGYYYSSRFCQYLENKVGLSGVLEILKSGDFAGVTGKSYEENYADWMASETN